VIVDEEHDAAFKSDRTPRIQARDLAVALGRLAGAAVVPRERHAICRDLRAGPTPVHTAAPP